jgi:hypothetical protein
MRNYGAKGQVKNGDYLSLGTYMVFDLATVLLLNGYDPDITREELVDLSLLPEGIKELPKHHAVFDAYLELLIFKKLMA